MMKKFKKVVLTIIVVIFSLTLSSCMGREPNEIAYIVALGIDKAENGNYEITIQYANTTQISGGASEEGGKVGNQIVENVTVEAPTIYGAIGLANHIVSKTFTLSHAKLIVFSKEVAEEGLKDLVETFIRSEELRPDVYLAVASDKANKYLTEMNPAMEVNPAKYYQLIFDKNALIGMPDGVAKNFFFSVETNDYDSLLPLAGVLESQEEQGGEQSGGGSGSSSEEGSGSSSGGSSGTSQEDTKNEKQKDAPINDSKFEYKIKSYTGGQAAIEQKNKSEAIGSAVFRDDKMVGTIGSVETEIYKLLIGDYEYSYLTLYNQKTPETPVTVKSMKQKLPRYDIDIENKRIKIRLFIEGDIYSLPADYNIESDIENFEENSEKYIEEASEKFIKDFMKQYNCDIFRFSERAKPKFLTNDEYNKFKDTVDYSKYDFDVEVKFEVRRTGLIVRD